VSQKFEIVQAGLRAAEMRDQEKTCHRSPRMNRLVLFSGARQE
jgi:hypothetical protein